jgi:CDP-diacylglycerol--serine O-phosphatidyltransferase
VAGSRDAPGYTGGMENEVHDDGGRPRARHIYLLPNLLTTGNLFAGFYAILAAANGDFQHACIAIVVAAVFDGIDGRVARLTGTTSAFGVQYDSLADLVSFGVAPALVMYHWALVSMRLDSPMIGKLGWAGAFTYMACAALRLARFNTQVGVVDKRWFIGLNSPTSAGLMVGFVWTMIDLEMWSGPELRFHALAVTVACALLMVSRVKYTSFKGSSKPDARGDRVPFWTLGLVVGVVVAFFIAPPQVLLGLTGAYALSGLVGAVWRRFARRGEVTA